MNASSFLSHFLARQVLKLEKGSEKDLLNQTVASIEIDSRKCIENSIFCALNGTQVKGIDFADKALEKGAKIIICHNSDVDLAANFPIILLADNIPKIAGLLAAHFFSPAPDHIVAVTGTNGKTSVASFFAEIMRLCDKKSGQLGTMGLIAEGFEGQDTLTSPDSITLHKLLNQLKNKNIEYVALEASSHGLDQQRLAGAKLSAVGYTNLTQDHLDYHKTLDNYFEAKARLFSEYASENTTCVVNMKDEWSDKISTMLLNEKRKIIHIGDNENYEFQILSREVGVFCQHLTLRIFEKQYKVKLPLIGAFQVENALVALGLAIGAGLPVDNAVDALNHIKGAKGRLEFIDVTSNGAAIVIDYAHTHDALTKALQSLREITENKLHVVFGAGGDRDNTKRSLMGEAAAEGADKIWVTDDNPRTEDASEIRKMIMQGISSSAIEIADRSIAIEKALSTAQKGDVVLIAGKGHEEYQEIGTIRHAYSDHNVVQTILSNQ